jgi:hypothetical protein
MTWNETGRKDPQQDGAEEKRGKKSIKEEDRSLP